MSETYLEPCQTAMIELFAEIADNEQKTKFSVRDFFSKCDTGDIY